MQLKKNISLILGIAIPIAMILFVAASIYLPALFGPQPKTDFLYVIADDYYGAGIYSVESGKLVKSDPPQNATNDGMPTPVMPPKQNPKPTLYYYDVAKNESREVTFAEAKAFPLDSKNISPDGYAVVNGGGNGGFPFDFNGSNYNTHYLKGHNISKKINTPGDGNYYYNFRFLGWVIK